MIAAGSKLIVLKHRFPPEEILVTLFIIQKRPVMKRHM